MARMTRGPPLFALRDVVGPLADSAPSGLWW